LNKNENKENPFKVNVISFSGHGITFDGDAIGVIPQIEKKRSFHTKRINMLLVSLTFLAMLENLLKITKH
jgi:hypothetical protein